MTISLFSTELVDKNKYFSSVPFLIVIHSLEDKILLHVFLSTTQQILEVLE
jgi:hypothetical protein